MQEIKEKWGGVLSLGVEKKINTEEKERGEANATKDIYKSLEKSYYIYLIFYLPKVMPLGLMMFPSSLKKSVDYLTTTTNPHRTRYEKPFKMLVRVVSCRDAPKQYKLLFLPLAASQRLTVSPYC